MSRSLTYINPLLGRLPGCFSLVMVHCLIRCLARPQSGGPAAYGRLLIQDALGMVDNYAPRDTLEAMLVMQIVSFHSRAQQALMRAAQVADPVKLARAERHAMALRRAAEALERQLWRRRRALAAEGEVHVSPPAWEYDLDALEAMWREAGPVEVAAADEAAADDEAMVAGAPGGELAAPRMLSRQQRRALERAERRLVEKLEAERRRLARAA